MEEEGGEGGEGKRREGREGRGSGGRGIKGEHYKGGGLGTHCKNTRGCIEQALVNTIEPLSHTARTHFSSPFSPPSPLLPPSLPVLQ